MDKGYNGDGYVYTEIAVFVVEPYGTLSKSERCDFLTNMREFETFYGNKP
jgi:hypothetical protein